MCFVDLTIQVALEYRWVMGVVRGKMVQVHSRGVCFVDLTVQVALEYRWVMGVVRGKMVGGGAAKLVGGLMRKSL